MAGASVARNEGMPLDLARLAAVRVTPSAVRGRIARLLAGPVAAPELRAAALVRAIECLDLTTLAGDDTPGRIRRLAARARTPLPASLARALGVRGLTVAAVCVFHEMLATAKEALAGSGIPVAVVSAGFPSGLSPLPARLLEIEHSAAAGADEIDVVIGRRHVLLHDWGALYHEVRAMRAACAALPMKVILATGELRTLQNVARASWVCMMAGADFIKTSTGKEAVNATLDASLVMLRAISGYAELTGRRVGFKPAGGVSGADQALQYVRLVEEELGDEWLRPERLRIGASSLLGNIELELARLAAGDQIRITRASGASA